MDAHSHSESFQPLPDIDSLWDYSNPAETEKRFKVVLPEAISVGDTSYHRILLTQIARTHSLRQQFDVAHEILDTVKSMLTEEMK